MFLGRWLNPLESGADLMILVGATGLITGAGGKYLFVFPVRTPASGPWGAAPFSIDVPGAWNSPGRVPPASSQNNLLTLGGLQIVLAYETGLPIGSLGLITNPNTNYYNYGAPTQDIYDASAISPGPLGKNAGWFFAGVLGLGLALRGGLEFF